MLYGLLSQVVAAKTNCLRVTKSNAVVYPASFLEFEF
jgi:hypothetical protein